MPLAALDLAGGLSEFVWSFAPPRRPRRPEALADLPAVTPESTALSKELKRRGFRFVGPTTVYALMQSAGLVDDHLSGCHAGQPVAAKSAQSRHGLGTRSPLCCLI